MSHSQRRLVLAHAQKLMANIQTASSQGAPSEAKQKLPEWMSGLAWAIARAFGCCLYFSWRDTPSGQRRNVTFYDFSERPAVAAYAFDMLSRQLKEATADYLKTQHKNLKMSTRRARAEQFRAGWVSGVRRVITAFAGSEQESQLMESLLANQKMGELQTQKMGEMGELQTRAPKACQGDDIARLRGYEAGQNARLHQGVQGAAVAGIGYQGGSNS